MWSYPKALNNGFENNTKTSLFPHLFLPAFYQFQEPNVHFCVFSTSICRLTHGNGRREESDRAVNQGVTRRTQLQHSVLTLPSYTANLRCHLQWYLTRGKFVVWTWLYAQMDFHDASCSPVISSGMSQAVWAEGLKWSVQDILSWNERIKLPLGLLFQK